MDGFLLINKPAGMTSRAVCSQVARQLGLRTGRKGTRIGHAGTLDPFATGVLIVLIGRATRLMPYVVGHDKRYLVGVLLGVSSDTDDITGTCTPLGDTSNIAESHVHETVHRLAASTLQVPPAVSAIHVNGERAWRRARRGETVEVAARPVRFDSIDIIDVCRDDRGLCVTLDVCCSSGTYMRSLARDIGEQLGVGGVAASLQRTRSGGFDITRAAELTEIDSTDILNPCELLGHMPRLELAEHDVTHIMHGRAVNGAGHGWSSGSSIALVASASGELVGIGRLTDEGFVAPRTVLQQPRGTEVVGSHG